MSAIETDGLGKRYGSTWALRECTLMIPEGSLAALVGPNGAGKTTLMQMLTGLAVPSAGTATVLGVAALLAMLVPGIRAATIPPVIVLQQE